MIKKGSKARKFKKAALGYIFVSPWLIYLGLFNIYAIAMMIYYSFTDFSLFAPPHWIGTENFSELFFYDPLFITSLYNTFYYISIAIPLNLFVALLLALILNQRVRGITIFRTIFYLPTIVPAVALSILWLWILHPDLGLLNLALAKVGIIGPHWLGSMTWSKPALIIMNVWRAGQPMIIFLAALQDLPRQLYEAAELDGAGLWTKFYHVTIPLMTPVIFFNLIMGLIFGFQIFTQALIMTEGGPAYSTLFYVLYVYQNAFTYLKMGYAAAQSLILFGIILVFTVVIVFTSKKWVYYGGEGK